MDVDLAHQMQRALAIVQVQIDQKLVLAYTIMIWSAMTFSWHWHPSIWSAQFPNVRAIVLEIEKKSGMNSLLLIWFGLVWFYFQ